MEETISKDNILISRKKAAQERRLQKKRELDRAYYLQNRKKKIDQRRQEKRELPTRPSRTRRKLKRDQERDQIKEKRQSIRDSVQASAFAASGAGFAAHSTSAGASAAQGRPALVVPTFVSTFLPPHPSHSLSIANMATTSSQDSVSSAATLPQANISSVTLFPVLN